MNTFGATYVILGTKTSQTHDGYILSQPRHIENILGV